MTYTKETYTIDCPTWALSYLINGDASGLTDEDIEQVDEWCEDMRDDTGDGYIVYDASDEHPSFNPYPCFGLPCDCITMTVHQYRPT